MRAIMQPAVKPDERVLADVRSELEWDPFVLDAEVEVEVHGGIVTLRGTANSLANRDAINDAAHRVHGVLSVVDRLTVQPDASTVRTDDDIEHAVRDVLRWDAHQPLIRVFGTVRCGIVTLRGSVDTWTQRCDAECTVRQLAGVRAVQNRVEVSDSPVACDTMRFQIEQAIERHAGPAGRRVRVGVDDGVVTLIGRVNSWAERKTLERIAGSMEGVRDVRNALAIDPLA